MVSYFTVKLLTLPLAHIVSVSEFGEGPQQQQEKLLTVHLSRSDDSLEENFFMAACVLFASRAQQFLYALMTSEQQSGSESFVPM